MIQKILFSIITIFIMTACTIEQQQPNIIFIMADDHAAHGLSCYGSNIIKTPNIDRIADEGMRFTQAVGVNSLCSPARAALITGKHSHNNSVKQNNEVFNGSQQTFPKLLQASGYETAIIGKWHLRSLPTGFNYYKVLDAHGSYFDPEFIEKGKERHRETGYLTNIITNSAIDWLEDKKGDRPFFLMVQHKAPHGPDIHEEKHARLFNDEVIPEPETIHDDWKSRDPLKLGDCESTKLINCHWQQDIYRELMASAPQEKQARTSVVYQQMIKGYKRLIASLDENIGELLDYIDESGLRENTIVIYTSDNGFFLGDHGLFNKMWIYEESLKIPLIVRWPGVVREKSVNDDLVNILDFAPTFLNIANASVPGDLYGRSIVPLLKEDERGDWRKTTYYHFYPYPGVLEHYGVRSKNYKLHHFPGYGDGKYWEFFNLNDDPKELKNVYNEAENLEIIEEMKEELRKHRQTIGIIP
ncbi:sulfatase [Sabulilitoribacter arenilitoris]|uniref:Sulfatase n=1 Tax=Wocania arenilitoris TaxID=2044858 RepID=A0AAE3ERJ6_9FLAO|nr:sulfatase [Wocania arenilitoris]MCF7568770.1 sulfatase [Wocania arenilitoris]